MRAAATVSSITPREAPRLAPCAQPRCWDCACWFQLSSYHLTDPDGNPLSDADKRLSLEMATGECRIAPPVACVEDGERYRAWPVTTGQDWCRSFDNGDDDDS